MVFHKRSCKLVLKKKMHVVYQQHKKSCRNNPVDGFSNDYSLLNKTKAVCSRSKKKAGLRIKFDGFSNKKTVRCFVSAEIIPFLRHMFIIRRNQIYTYIT